VIPKSQFLDPLSRQPSLSLKVTPLLHGVAMGKAVQFHREARAGAIKIKDVSSERMLTAKLESSETSGPQGAPDFLLLRGLVAAEATSIADGIHGAQSSAAGCEINPLSLTLSPLGGERELAAGLLQVQ